VEELYEFRCTRNTPYMHNCLGRDDISARQGYYIKARDAEDAIRKMAERFPEDTEGFTATKWQGFDVQVEEATD
jgi:hypothetical protein